MEKTTVYQDKKIQTSIIIFFLSALMIGFSVYLTQHYFDIKFPTGLASKSACNFNDFFNCDKTTLSIFGNILGVPIALYGVLIGALMMLGLIIKNEDYERTMYFTLGMNFIGCIFLFAYSLIVLKGLCPLCSLYYIVSGVAFFYFYKKSPTINPSIKYLSIFVVVVLAISVLVKTNIDSKTNTQKAVAEDLIRQYYALPNLGNPKMESEFKIASAPDAPIKMVIFSDFECPACKGLADLLPLIASRYSGKIDIQYFYYPLDNNCNPSVTRGMHMYACKAAYAATCMPVQDFNRVHDEIFENQEKFTSGFVDQYIKKNKLETCVADPATKEKVINLIRASDPFNIRSTPTYLINGVKIEGALPADQMFAIMDEILKRSGK